MIAHLAVRYRLYDWGRHKAAFDPGRTRLP
jgi:hypothetical protein